MKKLALLTCLLFIGNGISSCADDASYRIPSPRRDRALPKVVDVSNFCTGEIICVHEWKWVNTYDKKGNYRSNCGIGVTDEEMMHPMPYIKKIGNYDEQRGVFKYAVHGRTGGTACNSGVYVILEYSEIKDWNRRAIAIRKATANKRNKLRSIIGKQ